MKMMMEGIKDKNDDGEEWWTDR